MKNVSVFHGEHYVNSHCAHNSPCCCSYHSNVSLKTATSSKDAARTKPRKKRTIIYDDGVVVNVDAAKKSGYKP